MHDIYCWNMGNEDIKETTMEKFDIFWNGKNYLSFMFQGNQQENFRI